MLYYAIGLQTFLLSVNVLPYVAAQDYDEFHPSKEDFENPTVVFLDDFTEKPLTQNESVALLRSNGSIKSNVVRDVMSKVDIRLFENQYDFSLHYMRRGVVGGPLAMYAYVLEKVKNHLKPGSRAMDIAGLSGYMTPCMALMVGEKGLVVSLRYYTGHLKEAFEAHMPKLLKRVKFFDISEPPEGKPEYGPYDVIHYGVVSQNVSDYLIDQLKVGGRLIMPIADYQFKFIYTIFDKISETNYTRYEEPGGYVF